MGAVQVCKNKCEKVEDNIDIIDIDEPMISKTPRESLVKNKNEVNNIQSGIFEDIANVSSSRVSHTLVNDSNDMLIEINNDHRLFTVI
jgi:hypothetical protein